MEKICYEEQTSCDACKADAASQSNGDPRTVHTLREDRADVAGETVVYRLCALYFAAAQYFIEIVLGKERAAACVGGDASAAASLYVSLVSGRVTPCTLLSIVEDAFG